MTLSHCVGEPARWLVGSPLLGGLSTQATLTVMSAARRIKVDTDHVLFFQDDPGDAVYMIERGSIEISAMSVNGKKLSLNIMRRGDIFGEIAVLDGGPRTATATVLEPASLLCIDRSDLLSLMETHPTLAPDLISTLCNRLRWASRLVEDLGLLGIHARLASRLLILHREFSDNSGDLHLSQAELADFLGATRESINKVLRSWQGKGLIGLSRGSVRILDRTALERFTVGAH